MSGLPSLFRQEVMLYGPDREFGTPVYQQKSWSLWFVLLACLLLMAALALLVLTQYKETETVRGLLVASGGSHRVVAPGNAMVQDIMVEPGARVTKGQVLAALKVITFDQQGRNSQQSEIAQYKNRHQLLLDERRLQTQLYRQQQAQLLATIKQFQLAGGLLHEEQALLEQQLALSTNNNNAMQTLAKAHAISRSQLEQAQVEQLTFALHVHQAMQRQQANQLQITAYNAQLENLQLTYQQNQLNIKKELQQLALTLAQLTHRTQMTVVAEADGVVSSIAVAVDESVKAQQPLFYITSQPEALTATLYVPSRVLGQMYPGQELLLRYDAFDFQYFGRYRAVVTHIDRASLDPREHLLPLPGIQEPVFKITAQLDQAYVDGPDVYRLQRNMLFSADVVMADMSLLEFMFRPVLRMRARLS